MFSNALIGLAFSSGSEYFNWIKSERIEKNSVFEDFPNIKSEKINMSQEQKYQISSMLQKEGLSLEEIEKILNAKYQCYNSKSDLKSTFGSLQKQYLDIIEQLSNGYTMDELKTNERLSKKIDGFSRMIEEKNLTIDNIIAIYQYCNDSDMILGVKRGTLTTEKILKQEMSGLEEDLKFRAIEQEKIEKIKRTK